MSKKAKKEVLSKEEIYKAVKYHFYEEPVAAFTVKELSKDKSLKGLGSVHDIAEAVDTLVSRGYISKCSPDKYRMNPDKLNLHPAEVTGMTQYCYYVRAEGMDDDLVVAMENGMNALVGDKVSIVFLKHKRRGRDQGAIIKILERKETRFVGVVERSDRYAFIATDSKKMPFDIFVPLRDLQDAEDGEKVLVEITSWDQGNRTPNGRVVQRFGAAGDNNAEMHAILAEYGLPYHFEEAIEAAAEQIPEDITQSEIKKRRDFTKVTTFTIDPADAKDFDDALSIRRIRDGVWEIGVHIADVTHYVTEGSLLDKEAVDRATSVYLVDRVVPMLPERLSNGLCSLRPNEKKLCFSAVFEMDDECNILSEWFGRTVILSDRRFTYEEAQEVIETGKGDFAEEIGTLNRLAVKMRAARFKNGSIAFERDEPKFKLDENGKPLGVYFKVMKESNHLIEEFMLLANRHVAHFIGSRKKGRAKAPTFVYRIHDKPNEEKYQDFRTFASKFGYTIKEASSERGIARELNRFLGKIKGKKEENLFSILALRSMAKAIYSTDNIGHYGLAFDYYTHFTSPIRRYPDMMVHRLLQHYLDGGKSVDKEYYEDLCKHSSEREIRAAEAERASIKYKMVEFMSDKIDQEFDGFISGITEWGLFVELAETKIEGMVSVRDMADDTYNFDAENYRLVGVRSRRVIMLGDAVKIRVLRADLKRKQLDYELVAHKDYHTGKEVRFLTGSELLESKKRSPRKDRQEKKEGGKGRGTKKRR